MFIIKANLREYKDCLNLYVVLNTNMKIGIFREKNFHLSLCYFDNDEKLVLTNKSKENNER